jgi:hypothetical protein
MRVDDDDATITIAVSLPLLSVRRKPTSKAAVPPPLKPKLKANA